MAPKRLAQPLGYFGQGLIPGDFNESGTFSLEREFQSLTMVLVAADLCSFSANIAPCPRVVFVRSHLGDAVTGGLHLETAVVIA